MEISNKICLWKVGLLVLLLLPVKNPSINFCVPGGVDPATAVEQVPDLGGEVGRRFSG